MNADDPTKARFLMGLLLTWVPFVLFMAPIVVTVVRDISPQKATGLGAVAGGLLEGLMTFGLAAIVLSQVGALFMLARSFERDHAVSGFFSAVSICCSLFLVAFMALTVWLFIRFCH